MCTKSQTALFTKWLSPEYCNSASACTWLYMVLTLLNNCGLWSFLSTWYLSTNHFTYGNEITNLQSNNNFSLWCIYMSGAHTVCLLQYHGKTMLLPQKYGQLTPSNKTVFVEACIYRLIVCYGRLLTSSVWSATKLGLGTTNPAVVLFTQVSYSHKKKDICMFVSHQVAPNMIVQSLNRRFYDITGN